MLERLLAKNFQCHRRRLVEFSPTVSCIVGDSDVGKSALLRLLRWVALNRPLGDDYLRHGADYVAGHLWADGKLIKRERCGGDNSYWIGQDKYQAFGNSPPEEVTKLLNVGEVNFQLQHAAPYFFNLSPGEVSRELNQVVNLDLIDSTLTNLNNQVKRNKETVRVGEERLAAATARRDALAWVEDADRALKEVEALDAARQRARDDADALRSLLDEITSLEGEREQARLTIITLEGVLALGDKAATAREEAAGLASLLEEIQECREQLTDTTRAVAGAAKELAASTRGACPLCGSPVDDKTLAS